MRYALVTGGSKGIGRAACMKLSEMGYPVLINYFHSEDAAKETLQMIQNAGNTAELMCFDVADGKSVDKALEKWKEAHSDDYIAVLVNNAGIRRDDLMIFMNDENWHDVINTTVNGFFYVTRRLLKDMMTKRWGRIVTVASLSGIKGLPGQTNYSAAKAAVIGASKALAQEVASRKITVNVVAPGFIKTDMTKDLDEDTLKKQIPCGRFGNAQEVAAVIGFLASEDCSYTTGNVISINGGLYT